MDTNQVFWKPAAALAAAGLSSADLKNADVRIWGPALDPDWVESVESEARALVLEGRLEDLAELGEEIAEEESATIQVIDYGRLSLQGFIHSQDEVLTWSVR